MATYVFSRTLPPGSDAGVTIVGTDAVEFVVDVDELCLHPKKGLVDFIRRAAPGPRLFPQTHLASAFRGTVPVGSLCAARWTPG